MEEILEEFNLQFLLPELKEAGIEYRHLQFLNERDIADEIKSVGPRAEFREKLFNWKRKTHVNVIAAQTKIFSQKSLTQFLASTDVGVSIQNFYKRNECLTSEIRDKLINIILENTFAYNKKLAPSDFKQILEEICNEFAKEEQVSDYYYYPRKGKNAPGGKLFHRYHNYRAKNRKIDRVSLDETFGETDEFDEHVKQLKQELLWPLQSWDTICDRLSRTNSLRREDINNLTNVAFLKEWPILKDARAIDLLFSSKPMNIVFANNRQKYIRYQYL